jgi:hypothetical protein
MVAFLAVNDCSIRFYLPQWQEENTQLAGYRQAVVSRTAGSNGIFCYKRDFWLVIPCTQELPFDRGHCFVNIKMLMNMGMNPGGLSAIHPFIVHAAFFLYRLSATLPGKLCI